MLCKPKLFLNLKLDGIHPLRNRERSAGSKKNPPNPSSNIEAKQPLLYPNFASKFRPLMLELSKASPPLYLGANGLLICQNNEKKQRFFSRILLGEFSSGLGLPNLLSYLTHGLWIFSSEHCLILKLFFLDKKSKIPIFGRLAIL